MNVTEINQDALPVAAWLTYLAFLVNTPPEIVLGAFTGSVIFLLGSSNKSKWLWLLYFVTAFLSGLLGAQAIADLLSELFSDMHINVKISAGFGGVVAAACTINTLGWLRDNPALFWSRKQGDKS